jgi:lipoprotein-anchoring transpeptidase ErfK/SrfK
MGSRLLAGCLALLLFLILIGSGVLYFLKYQQDKAVAASNETALDLYLQPKRPENDPLDPGLRAQAIALWQSEVIPKAGSKPYVADALFFVAEAVADSDPETARAYWQRVADEFPESERRNEALVRLAEFSVRTNPEKAMTLYSEVLDSTSSSDLQADARLGVVLIEDTTGTIPSPSVREKYQEIVKNFPGTRAAAKARERLDTANRHLVFEDTNPNEFKEIYTVQKGDVLLKIANKYQVTAYIIEMLNGVNAKALHPNQGILVPTWGKVYAVVDKSEYKLIVFRESDNQFLLQYPVGIGKLEWKTQVGEYIVATKQIQPPWHDPKTGRLLRHEDPEYPLGERWMGLARPATPNSRTGLGIHGTNEPETIGTSSSAGCVRMTNEDAIEAFAIIRQNSRVVIQE